MGQRVRLSISSVLQELFFAPYSPYADNAGEAVGEAVRLVAMVKKGETAKQK